MAGLDWVDSEIGDTLRQLCTVFRTVSDVLFRNEIAMVRKRPQRSVSESSRNSVELLLAEEVPSLGKQGDLVRVKPGFARNYLVPQGLATIATEENSRMVERHKVKLATLESDRLKQLHEWAEAISKYSVTLDANANKDGHLYGSIGATEISSALKSAGYFVEPDQIRLEGPLKELGMYTVKVQLHTDINTEVKVWVVPSTATT